MVKIFLEGVVVEEEEEQTTSKVSREKIIVIHWPLLKTEHVELMWDGSVSILVILDNWRILIILSSSSGAIFIFFFYSLDSDSNKLGKQVIPFAVIYSLLFAMRRMLV